MSRKFQFDSAIAADIQTANADSYIDNLKMIDIDLVEPNKDNFYEISEVESLADDIERQGLMTALVVVETDGKYQLISGHRRLAALKSLIASGRRKSGKVPCFVTGEKNNTEARLDLIMLNATQRKYTDADAMREYEELTQIFKELEADGKPIKGRIRDKIAGALNVSAAQVGKMDNIKHNAIPDVEKAVKSGDMSISTANEVAKLKPEKQQEIICEKPKITHKEVKEIQRTEADDKPERDEFCGENVDDDYDDAQTDDVDDDRVFELSVNDAVALRAFLNDYSYLLNDEIIEILRKLNDFID